MQLSRSLTVFTIAIALIGCEAPPPEDSLAEKLATVMEEAPEPPALDIVAPGVAATLDRNQMASVVLVALPPGERISEHDAGPRAIYALTDASLVRSGAGAGGVHTYAAGEVDVWPESRYGIDNAGDSDARFIVMTRTAEPLEAPAAATVDAAELEEPVQASARLHSGNHFIIESLLVEPGHSRKVACENPCAVYTLTPATLLIEQSGADDKTMDVFEDRSVWFEGGSSATVEAGEQEVRLVVFELKK